MSRRRNEQHIEYKRIDIEMTNYVTKILDNNGTKCDKTNKSEKNYRFIGLQNSAIIFTVKLPYLRVSRNEFTTQPYCTSRHNAKYKYVPPKVMNGIDRIFVAQYPVNRDIFLALVFTGCQRRPGIFLRRFEKMWHAFIKYIFIQIVNYIIPLTFIFNHMTFLLRYSPLYIDM